MRGVVDRGLVTGKRSGKFQHANKYANAYNFSINLNLASVLSIHNIMTETEAFNRDTIDFKQAEALADIICRCDQVMAHAWMVRTFIKHSEEVEDFPELMGVARVVFDLSRALETRIDDPPSYLKMLQKKIAKLKKAAREFEKDAPLASTHTNFKQAVYSMNTCCEQLQSLLNDGIQLLGSAAPK